MVMCEYRLYPGSLQAGVLYLNLAKPVLDALQAKVWRAGGPQCANAHRCQHRHHSLYTHTLSHSVSLLGRWRMQMQAARTSGLFGRTPPTRSPRLTPKLRSARESTATRSYSSLHHTGIKVCVCQQAVLWYSSPKRGSYQTCM